MPVAMLTRNAALGVYAFACVCEVVAICWLNQGHFLYSLDDPYIHLAVAENIARGTYGVNLGEFSSPCSSMLWPFLLVPGALFSVGRFVPLVLSCAAGALTLLLMQRVLRSTALVLLLMLCCNVVGLVFTGMEHSVHVLCVVAILVGCVEQAGPPRYVWLALALAPWLRYEGLAVSAAFAVVLWVRGYRREVSTAMAISLAGLAGFSWFLYQRQLELLPSSIIVRGVSELADRSKLRDPHALTLAAAVLLWLGIAAANRAGPTRQLALALVFALCAHLGFGKFGGFSRYEAYIWTLNALGLAWVVERSSHARRWSVALALGLALVSVRMIHRPFVTPFAARDMLRQQLQLHRFAVDYYRRPVAVNDLGLVAYQNDNYVLDLVGLGSREVFEHRQSDLGSGWLDALTRKHAVGLVMIYRSWFPDLPAPWIALGTLRMASSTAAADPEVSFFATSNSARDELRPLLESFARDLPAGAYFASQF